MDDSRSDPKSLFNLKRSRFEVKSFTVDSLLAERNQLYDKLQQLSDEADSYAKYISKQNNEKNLISQDLSEFKLSCELLTLQKSRLENQNKILQVECCGLLDLVSKIGPSELYNLDSNSSVTTESVITKIKNSVKVLCDDRQNLVCVKDSLHQELCLVKSSLRNANKTICKLNKEINDLNIQILDNGRETRSRRNSIETKTQKPVCDVSNSTPIHEKCASAPNITEIMTVLKTRENFSASTSFEDTPDLLKVKDSDGTFKISNLQLCKLKESLELVPKSIKSLIDHTNDAKGIELKEFNIDTTTINSASDLEKAIKKYRENICNALEGLKTYICKINSYGNNLEDENNMLNSELKMLKYALTCRIELKKHQGTSTDKVDKNAEINRLNNDIEALKHQINELEVEIETVRGEKRSLLALLDSITASN